MASRMAWFLTPAGRRFSYGCMTVGSLTALSVQVVPHTYLLQKYKEIVSMYEAANPVPVAADLMKRFADTLNDLKIEPSRRENCKPFTVFGFDVFHAGSMNTSYGAIVGLPINFTYKNVDTINSRDILVNHEPVNWEREDAKQLLEALVLSEDAQRYAIAREVLTLRENVPLVKGAINCFMFSSVGFMNRALNKRFKLLEHPFSTRFAVYILAFLFTFGIWSMQTDMYVTGIEREIDAYLAEAMGDRYVTGAIEFYEKMLKRNIALRSLLGDVGENSYTSTGKEKYLFRQPHIAIDERLEFFINCKRGSAKGNKELPHENKTVPQTTEA